MSQRVPGNRDRYARVNKAWPSPLPELTKTEASKAVKQLWRFATKRKWLKVTYRGVPLGTTATIKTKPLKIVFGRKRGWFRDGYHIKLTNGWVDLVHVLSHETFNHLRRHGEIKEDEGFHGTGHASHEYMLIQEVLKRGWLDGRLKAKEKPKPTRDLKKERASRIEKRIAMWQRKLKRAETALKKLKTQQRYYQRKLPEQQEAA